MKKNINAALLAAAVLGFTVGCNKPEEAPSQQPQSSEMSQPADQGAANEQGMTDNAAGNTMGGAQSTEGAGNAAPAPAASAAQQPNK